MIEVRSDKRCAEYANVIFLTSLKLSEFED